MTSPWEADRIISILENFRHYLDDVILEVKEERLEAEKSMVEDQEYKHGEQRGEG